MENNFNFNFKKTAVYRAVKWAKIPLFGLAGKFKKLFLILFVLFFLADWFLIAPEIIGERALFDGSFLADLFVRGAQFFILWGWSVIFLVFFLGFWLSESFLNLKLKKPELKATLGQVFSEPGKYNLADFLSFEAARAVEDCLVFSKKIKISKISSTLLFYFLISHNENLNFVFSRALLNLNEIKELLKKYFKGAGSNSQPSEVFYQKDFQDSILESFKAAEKKNHSRIEVGDLIVGLSRHDLIFQKILVDNNLKSRDIENLVRWLEVLQEKTRERKKFWEWKNLVRKGFFAKEWASGYTVTLDRFSIDLSEEVKKRNFREIIGHKKEIEAMERILSGSETNNVLIVGEPGSGRKSMVYAIANKSVLGEGLPQINNKRIIQLNLPGLLSQIPSAEEVEAVLDNIFREAVHSGNVILVIDEFHNFVGRESRPGVVDISGVLSPYLSSPSFQIIAISTFEGLHKNIEQNSSLLSLFEKVEVSEISERETLILLENLGLSLEQKHKKFISYPALREIIGYCSKYLPAIAFPEKAMDLLDEAMVYLAQEKKDKILLPKHIARLVSEKTRIPVGEIEEKEKEILLNLESLMHEKIVNQEEAVREVSASLRRARSEVSSRSGPIGTFLFLGPTGVGKTETSKALAQIYFHSGQGGKFSSSSRSDAAGFGEQRMIRLDMSEFQSVADIPRLIGSPGEEGLLTTQAREKPFSLILLDEIEKAHPNILNLFLQVLDEGHLTDGLGRKVDFKNLIIIATSNAGYQIILKAIKEERVWASVKEEILDYLFKEGTFRPEFINRFDAVVVFKPLSKENLLKIAGLMLENLKKNLEEKEIEFVVSQELKEKIVELSYEPAFGARQMKRVIQDKVENILAQAILEGRLTRGSRVEVDSSNFELRINS